MRLRFSSKGGRASGNGMARYFSGSSRTKFAWLPARLGNGTWIWLERYRVHRADS